MTNFRDSVFRRPHPLFWRFIHGAAVLYVLLLVFAVFQSPNSIRHLLTYVDPSLGARLHTVFPFPFSQQMNVLLATCRACCCRDAVSGIPLAERSYAIDCRLCAPFPPYTQKT